MSWLEVIGIAVGLAMDAFAVSVAVGVGLHKVEKGHIFRVSWYFGLFQFLMPIAGWAVGRLAADYVEAYDHWVAFALLGVIGGKMLYEAVFHTEEEAAEKAASKPDPTRGWTLILLSIAVSIDALAVGLSMAFLAQSIWIPAVIIGVVAGVLSLVGIVFGGRLGRRSSTVAEIIGGLVLIGIGVNTLVSHLRDHG